MGRPRKGTGGISAVTLEESRQDDTLHLPKTKTVDDEESRLTSLLFGEQTEDLVKKLPLANKRAIDQVKKSSEFILSDDLFQIDKGKSSLSDIVDTPALQKRKPAWSDDSHAAVNVSLIDQNRLKKLRVDASETKVSGIEFENRLRSQFEKMHPKPSWADLPNEDRMSLSSDEEEEMRILRKTDSFLQHNSPVLQPDTLEITKMKDANVTNYSNCVIQSTRFHSNGQLLFTAGYDKSLRLFQIDGQTNPKVQSAFFDNFPIHDANYTTDGRQVIVTSRRKYFYAYDLESNKSFRISGLQGREEKSLESFSVSPDGRFLAFIGKDGNILLVSQQTKQLITTCKMNGDVRSVVFSLDGHRMFSHGTEGVVYDWDMRYLQPMTLNSKFRDAGCLKGLSMAVNNHYLATGSDSGVVNIYNITQLGTSNCEPVKALMNLTTPIQHVQFNHDGQLLGMSSRSKKDAFRLVHLPTMRVFQNWPTNKTPLHYVQTFDFSPKSGYLALGNDSGKVLLYKLHHYSTA